MKIEKNQILKVAFETIHDNWHWERQLPSGDTSSFGVKFFVPISEADVLVVFDAISEDKFKLPRSIPTIFVASEPANVKRYNSKFLAQFDAVITTDRETPHPTRIFVQPGLPWFVGSMTEGGELLDAPMGFNEFKRFNPEKKKLLSVVTSNKTITSEHQARLDFVMKLKEEFGDEIDVFGRGINDFDDKQDVLSEYKYHIALENCSIEDYWTEKLADPFLTLTFPIYFGCPNVHDYFEEGSLKIININNFDESVATIREIINSNIYEASFQNIISARDKLMTEHNIFSLLARVSLDIYSGPISAKSTVEIRSESSFVELSVRVKSRLYPVLKKYPLVHKAYRLFKKKEPEIKREIDHRWKYLTDQFYRSHHRWITTYPEDEIRFDYELPRGANVLDLGGFRGDFANEFLRRFDANITVMEPVPNFAQNISKRFEHDAKVTVIAAGMSDRDQIVEFCLDADASGIQDCSYGEKISVELFDVERFMREQDVSEWHLVKLNIEGGEYAVLNRLVDTGRILDIQYLQIQFHLNIPDAKSKYSKLVKRLKKTHKRQWCYPFVWESWVRK